MLCRPKQQPTPACWTTTHSHQPPSAMALAMQVNHDYESVKMLDLGMSAEDAKADPGSDASSDGSSSSEEDGKGGGLAEDVAQLKSELAEARQQIGRMLEIQEALARQALSSKAFKALFEQ